MARATILLPSAWVEAAVIPVGAEANGDPDWALAMRMNGKVIPSSCKVMEHVKS